MRVKIVIIVLCVILTVSFVFAQDSSDVRMVSRMYDYWHATNGVDVQGDYAYVASGLSGLQVVDISNRDEPEVVGAWNTRLSPGIVAVSGDIACVALWDISSIGVAAILDISNPTQPEVVGAIDSIGLNEMEGSVDAMWIEGNALFVTSSYRVYIFDLADPTEPRQMSYLGEMEDCYSVQGDYLYTSTRGNGFREYFMVIFDISDLANPVETGRCDIEGHPYVIDVHGDYVYASSHLGFSVIDVSNPEQPEEITTLELEESGFNLTVSDGYANINEKLIDISDPTEPFIAGNLGGLSEELGDAKADPDYLYVVDYDKKLKVYDISNLEEPILSSAYPPNGTVYDVSLVGDVAFIADDAGGLKIVDVSDPVGISEIGSYQTEFSIRNISVHEDLAIISLHQEMNSYPGFEILDVSTPGEPALISTFNSRYVNDIAFFGNFAYLISPSVNGIYTLDISDPSNPSTIDTTRISCVDEDGFPVSVYAQNGTVQDNFLYVTGSGIMDMGIEYGALNIFSLDDPAEINLVGGLQTDLYLTDIAIDGNYAYLAYADGMSVFFIREMGVLVVNIEDPTNPEIVSTYQVSSRIQDMKISDNFLFVSNLSSGLRVINISDPVNLHELGFHETQGLGMGIDIRDNYAYVADYTNFSIYDCSQAMSVSNNDVLPPGNFQFVSASPNPFNNSVTINFEIYQPGEVLLNIYDLRGREILSQTEFVTGGTRTMVVNSNQLGSAGMYFARISANGMSISTKLVSLP
jgi:hypothetical protein